MADDLGAVRRTPRPTGDRQTPETVAQLPRGATNTASAPVDAETAAGSGTGDLRAKFLDTFLRVTRDTADGAVMAERFIAEGWRPAQPSEGPLAVHFAGPYVTIGGRRRQLCAWCGHVLLDVQLAPGQEHEPWFDVKLVRVEDGATTRQPYTYGDPLPPGCCALPDDEGQADDGLCSRCSAPAVDDLNFVDPFCRQHLTEAYDAEAAAEDENREADGPDEAQETRAAADWPAEPVDTPAEGDHV